MNRKINMRPVVLGIVMIVLLLIFIPTTVRASSDIEVILNDDVDPKLEELTVKMHYEVIQAWHHSDKRWSNEKLGIFVPDSKLGGDIQQLERYLIPDTGYPFDVPLPYEVIQAMNQGKKISMKVESAHPGYKLEHVMNYLDQPEKYPVTISGNSMRIMMHPFFNYETAPDGSLIGHMDANFDINLNIPFAKQMFGMNTYSVFGNGLNARPMASSFASGINSDKGELHFSRIDPKTGVIKPSYMLKITNTGQMVPSAGLRVGASEGVFNNAGGFGLSFQYPLNFRFFVEGEGKSDIVMRALELIDEDGKVIESFRRNIDPADPFNQSKQTLVRTSTSPVGASTLDPEKTYKLRATDIKF